MGFLYKAKRVAKELLDRPQAPKIGKVTPRTFEEQIYAASVEAGDTCFDVGANFGSVTIFLARVATATGRVIAFEPNIVVYGGLCQNVQNDPYMKAPIMLLPIGLSDAPGPRQISIPRGIAGMGSLAPLREWGNVQNETPENMESQTCDFVTLDDIIADGRYPKPDFIKIDVEGAEKLVLQGGRKMFKNGLRPLMLIELFAPWEHAFGYGPWDILKELLELDYKFLFACPEGLVAHSPSSTEPFPPQYERGYNIIAYRVKEHAYRVQRLARLKVGADPILPMEPPPVSNKIPGAVSYPMSR